MMEANITFTQNDLNKLKEKYSIQDFNYKLVRDDNTLDFIPLTKIDQLIFTGIMNS